MPYTLYITPHADRSLRRLPLQVQKAIRKGLDVLARDPFAQGLPVKKLQGREGYRLRVGNYRVIYRLYTGKLVIEVLEAAHRKEIY